MLGKKMKQAEARAAAAEARANKAEAALERITQKMDKVTASLGLSPSSTTDEIVESVEEKLKTAHARGRKVGRSTPVFPSGSAESPVATTPPWKPTATDDATVENAERLITQLKYESDETKRAELIDHYIETYRLDEAFVKAMNRNEVFEWSQRHQGDSRFRELKAIANRLGILDRWGASQN